MRGHLLFVSRDAKFASKWSKIAAEWLLQHGVDPDPLIYICHDLVLAERSIQIPLKVGQPPALIILDHSEDDQLMADFSHRLRNCIPETWIMDLIPRTGILPSDPQSANVISKPFKEEDWDEMFHHLFFQAQSPQWSKSNQS